MEGSPRAARDTHDPKLSGTLLGTALGDALGLPLEGLSARAIARRFGRGAAASDTPPHLTERFRLLGRTGYVSDDTEQSALVAQSLARHPNDNAACVAAFRRSMGAWLLRLPFGLGFSTLRACLRILVGLRPSGVASAGNGAAMRAAIIGVFYRDAPETRRAVGQGAGDERVQRGVAQRAAGQQRHHHLELYEAIG